MKELMKEFWRQGLERTAPGLPLGLARMVMGIFWLSQFAMASDSIWIWGLTGLTGASLSLGFLTSIGAVGGVALSVIYAVYRPPWDPLWPYALLGLIHLLLLFTHSGRNLGLDQLLIERFANWPRRRPAWLTWIEAVLL